MRIGIWGASTIAGTIDDVVAEARHVEEDGLDSYWACLLYTSDAADDDTIV